MNLKEILKNHGIENEDLEKALDDVIQVTVTEKQKDSVPYARFKEVVSERNDLKSKLAEVEIENETFKTKIQNVEEMKSQFEEANQKLKTYQENEFKSVIDNAKKYLDFYYAKEDDKNFENAKKFKDLIQLPENRDELTQEHLEQFKPIMTAIDVSGVLGQEQITPTPKATGTLPLNQSNPINQTTQFDRLMALQKSIKN